MLALPLVMQTSLGKASAPFGKKEVIVISVWGDAAVGIYNKKQNDTTECYFSKAFVFMNSCHNATKNDRQWCHHFTIFVGQATARMASQENQPSSCDVAGSAMPREDALLNLTSPSWEKSAIPPQEENYKSNSCSSNLPMTILNLFCVSGLLWT